MLIKQKTLRMRPKKVRIGWRTLKTATAVVIAMAIVNIWGTTTSKLIFAMLGAMAAMEPTFKESVEACLTQIIGVLFGAVIGVLLLELPIPYLASAGIGIILVITLYNMLHIRFSPSLPCMIVVMICSTPDIQPFTYAIGRIWDSAIGLSIGLFVNTMIFPYDTRSQMRGTIKNLDSEVIHFLEDMFDGDNKLPNTKKLYNGISILNEQLTIFSNQWVLLNHKPNREDLESFQLYEKKAHQLIAHMEVLCNMDQLGTLNEETRNLLIECNADIQNQETTETLTEQDIITNYHVSQLLLLRQELLNVLKK